MGTRWHFWPAHASATLDDARPQPRHALCRAVGAKQKRPQTAKHSGKAACSKHLHVDHGPTVHGGASLFTFGLFARARRLSAFPMAC